MAYKTTQHVSAPNLKLFGPMKTELRVKEVEEFSIQLRYLYDRKIGQFFFPQTWLPQYKRMDIF